MVNNGVFCHLLYGKGARELVKHVLLVYYEMSLLIITYVVLYYS